MKCYLSQIAIQSVHTKQKYFKRSTHVDLYENNCAFRDTLNAARCHFQRVHSSGLTDVFDERLSKVESVEDCERLCLRWRDGMCRSYTYDKSGHICYLSHVTSRSLGLNPLDFMTNSNLSTADLDDCFQCE
ncbi:unnamed protein product, partial [Anisakis simplex]|uniref:Apple domain-containing protein n=1 Tax=Anisakis simplex TaxID=6269 RepID=A0A0M3J4P1_ANISI